MALERIGEVIQASTREFGAQGYHLHQPPPLGSLVSTPEGPRTVYGIVYSAATESLDPGRKPVARGGGGEGDAFKEHPQLARLLRTTFQAVVVGYKEGVNILQRLPPYPARLYSPVHLCSDEESAAFFALSTDFLHTLAASSLPGSDEVIAACLRRASRALPDPQPFLVQAGKALAPLLQGQLPRLIAILKRLE